MKAHDAISMINRLFEQLVRSKRSRLFEPENDESFGQNEGVHFCVKIDADSLGFPKDNGNDYHPEWVCRVIKYFHVIILHPNYVFVCLSDVNNQIPQDGWKNTSNHSSCWRDGCSDLGKIGYDTWCKAFSLIPEDKRPSFDESVLYSLDLSILGNIFEFVLCDVEPDYETDDSGYHKKISNIKKIQKKLTY